MSSSNAPVAKRIALAVLSLAFLVSCSNRPAPVGPVVNADNLVVSGDPSVDRTIGEEKRMFKVLGVDAIAKLEKAGKIQLAKSLQGKARLSQLADEEAPAAPPVAPAPDADAPTPPVTPDTSLMVGFPVNLLGEHQTFGAVITAVTDKENEDLGMLKLTDLPPLHVKPIVVRATEDQFVLALMGCARECSEGSAQEPLITIPVLGTDEAGTVVILDLAALGGELNLIQMLDPEGAYTKLKTKISQTVSVDYSLSTLVFDIKVTMIPLAADPAAPGVKETDFTVRWYMRLGSGFNPAFESRPATDGVGFFMTERSASPKITRFSRFKMEGLGDPSGPVHYYIKNVPPAHQAAFKASFDAWNREFSGVMTAPLLTYEFIAADDPRSALLVTGDIRYNIVEWDLVNAAPYGGLGPSIANQFTGETMSANTLVQGPKIVELYTKWFQVAQQAQELRAEGDEAGAERLLAEGHRAISRQVRRPAVEKPFSLSMGKGLAFRVTSQLPELSDPLFARDDFEMIPPGVTFETYMAGYFEELVSHELGHNVGLRHNFRGNLSAKPGLVLGHVSHSIMEYLGRGFRHLNRIAEYDVMALKYGYTGVKPAKLGMFCTDENVATAENAGSPECSRDDATADPFGYLQERLRRATDLLIGRGLATAPTWTLEDMAGQLDPAVKGLGFYAVRANAPGVTLTNFFGIGDRPTDPAEVKAYTVGKLKERLCDASFAEVLAMKESDVARLKTLENIRALREKVVALVAPLTGTDQVDLSCGELP